MAKRKKSTKPKKAPVSLKQRVAKKPSFDPSLLEDDEEEIVDDSPDIEDPDEGKYRDELRMGEPEGRDPLFDDDNIEKKGSAQRFRIDG